MTYRQLINAIRSSGADLDDDATVELAGEAFAVSQIRVVKDGDSLDGILDAGHLVLTT